jgi:hypothetical protein
MIIGLVSCVDKKYPCPAYNTRGQIRYDTLAVKKNKKNLVINPKTGLIIKKKDKRLLDKKVYRPTKVF